MTQSESGLDVAGLFDGFGNLYASAFSTASGVNLGLDHGAAGARIEQISGGSDRLVAVVGNFAAWHSHTKLLENRFRLVLVNFHCASRTGAGHACS